jgi:hypothetical protein
VVVSQGKRDFEALQELIALEEVPSKIQRLVGMIQLLVMFTQSIFITFLSQSDHPVLVETIIAIILDGVALQGQQIIGLAFAAVLLGPQTWSTLPKLFSALKDQVRATALLNLSPLLCDYFNPVIGNWICENWRSLEGQTLELVRALKETPSQFTNEILSISTIVDVSGHLKEFIQAC